MQKPSEEMYAVFCGQVNEQSAHNLTRNLASATRTVKHVHLLFQSNGGLTHHAVELHQFLKFYPITISIYNGSCLQSAGVEVYLGAKNRIVSANAKFMIHGAFIPGSVLLQQTEEELRRNLENLIQQNKRLKDLLRKYTKIPREDISKISEGEFWYSAKEAIKFGIATSIGNFSPPKGTKIETFS